MKIYKTNNVRRGNIRSVIPEPTTIEGAVTVNDPLPVKEKYKTIDIKSFDVEKIEEFLKKLPILESIGVGKIDELLKKMNTFEIDNKRVSDLDMKNFKIVNLRTPEEDSDAVTKLFLSTFITRKLLNIQKPLDLHHAANKEYVDSKKQSMCIFSNGVQDGVQMKFFTPFLCLENCTLKKVHFINLSQEKGNLYIHVKKLNDVVDFSKSVVGSKTKNGDFYEFPCERLLNEKTFIFFSFDGVSTNTNVVLFYEM
jgi:hypothetical protein